ncbi:nucleoside/nucleotide kinase family protein [Nocardioides mesophilus]|uniref:Nucleoside/nucleotide kinase family protein n=1 Tax=Nocardioides mesophilus TaxID=433659 RepID=A0A7G9R9Z2_9ACTN|nr:nucleoside/nucleotide kinase family protein [Nocardioides mesophilus]QNN52417.1 nucleoside/nucleotide kinase family protein [Nocardioides mesophilus]
MPTADLAELTGHALRLVPAEGRAVLGITGPPGAGKSTLAGQLLAAVTASGALRAEEVALVPMDGFHLADAQLDRLGLRERKGAPATFDLHGYLATLRRLHCRDPDPVYVPAFERDLEQPLAAARVVLPQVRLVVTEGNYLLLREGGWERVRALLDETWYVDVADRLRRERLIARHVRFGKDPAAAAAWVEAVDEPNARLVAAGRTRADRVVAG